MLILLRLYFLQHWFHLSDPGADDALDPEGNTRFPQQLAQIGRGWAALMGEDEVSEEGMKLIARVGFDCLPPRRGEVLKALMRGQSSYSLKIANPVVDRAIEDLVQVGLAEKPDRGAKTLRTGTASSGRRTDAGTLVNVPPIPRIRSGELHEQPYKCTTQGLNSGPKQEVDKYHSQREWFAGQNTDSRRNAKEDRYELKCKSSQRYDSYPRHTAKHFKQQSCL